MCYIDGFVIAVPTANKQQFIEHARQLDPIFIELGALRVIEAWGDDVPDGKVTEFRRAVQATAEEPVAFSCVDGPDKGTRHADRGLVTAGHPSCVYTAVAGAGKRDFRAASRVGWAAAEAAASTGANSPKWACGSR